MVKFNDLAAFRARLKNTDAMMGGSSPFDPGDDFPFSLDALRNAVTRRVRVAAPANVDIASAPAAIDGVTMAAGEYVLLPEQTDLTQARIWKYPAAAGQPFVAAEIMEADGDIEPAMKIEVAEGATYGGQYFVLVTAGPYELGVTELVFLPVIIPAEVAELDAFLAELTPGAPGATKYAVCFDSSETGIARIVLVPTDDLGGAGAGLGPLTPDDLGTLDGSSGLVRPDFTGGPFKKAVNNGPFTLLPPDDAGIMQIEFTNGAAAEAPDDAMFPIVGGTYDATQGGRVIAVIDRHQKTPALSWRAAAIPGEYAVPLVLNETLPAGMPFVITGANFDNANHLQAIFDVLQASGPGGDIRLYRSTGKANRLACEVRAITIASKLVEVWGVSDIELAAGEPVWFHGGTEGGGLSQPAENAAFGRRAVYPNEIIASHDLAKNLVDNVDFTLSGTSGVAGPNGFAARNFAGGSNRALAAVTADPSAFTVRLLINRADDNSPGQRIVDRGTEVIVLKHDTDQIRIVRSFATTAGVWDGGSRPPPSTWGYMAFVLDGAATPVVRSFGGNVSMGVTQAPAGAKIAGAAPWCFGNEDGSPTVGLVGSLSEVRVSAAALSSAFRLAEESNFTNPGAFAPAGKIIRI